MSASSSKKLRKVARKEAKEYIRYLKEMKLRSRLVVAWSILKGSKGARIRGLKSTQKKMRRLLSR
jgi:hypothetical protein